MIDGAAGGRERQRRETNTDRKTETDREREGEDRDRDRETDTETEREGRDGETDTETERRRQRDREREREDRLTEAIHQRIPGDQGPRKRTSKHTKSWNISKWAYPLAAQAVLTTESVVSRLPQDISRHNEVLHWLGFPSVSFFLSRLGPSKGVDLKPCKNL